MYIYKMEYYAAVTRKEDYLHSSLFSDLLDIKYVKNLGAELDLYHSIVYPRKEGYKYG